MISVSQGNNPWKSPRKRVLSIHDGQLEPIELRRHFSDTIALDGLSFVMPRGQVYGFLARTSYGGAILRTGSKVNVRQVRRSAA